MSSFEVSICFMNAARRFISGGLQGLKYTERHLRQRLAVVADPIQCQKPIVFGLEGLPPWIIAAIVCV